KPIVPPPTTITLGLVLTQRMLTWRKGVRNRAHLLRSRAAGLVDRADRHLRVTRSGGDRCSTTYAQTTTHAADDLPRAPGVVVRDVDHTGAHRPVARRPLRPPRPRGRAIPAASHRLRGVSPRRRGGAHARARRPLRHPQPQPARSRDPHPPE